MSKSSNDLAALDIQELEAVYAISQAVCRTKETDSVLEEIIHLARPVFVFDNIVLYLTQGNDHLEPSFARAMGRGRSEEAELAWGEITASQAIRSRQIAIREEADEDVANKRMGQRYYLGLPMVVNDQAIGALVFIRYGGPPFVLEQTRLVQFIASQLALLQEHRRVIEYLSTLEVERRQERLQDDFVATISHELRTPLGFIKGYATTLLRKDTTWDNQKRSEFLTIIDEEADRLRELIDNLLDSSRLQSGTLRMDFQPVRLETLLKDTVLRAQSFDENLDIELKLASMGVQVQADPTRMAQVFDNLISNAIKYAPDSKVTISLTAGADQAHIVVRDYGPGIPAAHLGKIFARFYRVPTGAISVRGTGLGLFICRRIIRAHSGEITAESQPGEGAAFHIFLPCKTVESGIGLQDLPNNHKVGASNHYRGDNP